MKTIYNQVIRMDVAGMVCEVQILNLLQKNPGFSPKKFNNLLYHEFNYKNETK